MNISIESISQDKQAQWDSYVSKHQNFSPYHLFAWGQAVERAYRHKAFYLTAYNDQKEICGVMPLSKISKLGGGSELCSLPFCDVGGILFDDETVRAALLDKALDLMCSLACKSLDIRQAQNTAAPGEESEIPTGTKVRMFAALPNAPDVMWDGFKSKLRSQIRKAEKNGLSYEVGEGALFLDEFYRVFAQNMRDLGSPVHAKNWFDEIVKQYAGHCVIGIVRLEQLPVGAGLVLYRSGGNACIPWASTLLSHNRLAPNMMLYWRLIEYAINQGCTSFDFGRSSFGEGTFKFKSQWGAQPSPLQWQKYDSDKNLVSENISSGSKTRELVADCWKKLPLSVANSVGPLLRRRISL